MHAQASNWEVAVPHVLHPHARRRERHGLARRKLSARRARLDVLVVAPLKDEHARAAARAHEHGGVFDEFRVMERGARAFANAAKEGNNPGRAEVRGCGHFEFAAAGFDDFVVGLGVYKTKKYTINKNCFENR